jgi:hypothetical protein
MLMACIIASKGNVNAVWHSVHSSRTARISESSTIDCSMAHYFKSAITDLNASMHSAGIACEPISPQRLHMPARDSISVARDVGALLLRASAAPGMRRCVDKQGAGVAESRIARRPSHDQPTTFPGGIGSEKKARGRRWMLRALGCQTIRRTA